MNKLASWETLTGTCPTIESDRTIAVVSFPLKSAIQRKAEDSDVPINVPVNVPVKVPVKLTETQNKVLHLIKDNPSITHLEISKRLSISEKTAKRTTKVLRELRLIKREGSDKNGQWRLSDS